MRHGSLFSGGGGFDLAAEKMGWKNIFHCEKDMFCQTILQHYWPDAATYEDIGDFDATPYKGRIDIITGGFPCQPFSAAGKRAGTADDRYLWPAMYRVIREVKPRWVVCENVYGLLNWTRDWSSTRCNLIWKVKVTKSHRMYCQLQVSTPRTKGTGSGLSESYLSLPPQGTRKLLPTPTAFDGNAPGFSARLRRDETPDNTSKLTAYVLYNRHKLLPTPIASDSNHKRRTENWRGDDLGSRIQDIVGRTGRLNPRFVGEMMGFPPDWTVLPFQNGLPVPSVCSATPSCLNSPCSCSKQLNSMSVCRASLSVK